MWKKVEEKYYINEKGQLKNINTNKILTPKKSKKGYLFYTISIDGKLKDLSAHRMVANAFLPKENNNQNQVNHKNGIKTDNSVENLEWTTPSENMKHAKANDLLDFENTSKKVIAKLNGKKIKEFTSVREAARQIKGYSSCIVSCCKGKRKTHKGYEWEYMNTGLV